MGKSGKNSTRKQGGEVGDGVVLDTHDCARRKEKYRSGLRRAEYDNDFCGAQRKKKQ